ncbi:MAG TPA: metallophosphoesterase [Candidatus Limnocylindrales bacterium]|nr:metallophosphoesterase [Candidatus Limnocylindrales bacterium]
MDEERRALARSAGLVGVVFLGTLVVLLGLALAFRGRDGGGGESSPTLGAGTEPPATVSMPAPPAGGPSASVDASSGQSGEPDASAAGPTGAPSGDPVLVGAGDIATCSLDDDSATAALIDGIGGAVFTAGDNAYGNGSADDFGGCYEPTWGRFKDRTRPSAGNHDWATQNAQGYRDYFGAQALNADGDTWYSYDLGGWHVVVLDGNCSKVDGCGPDSPQGRWLAADLAASNAVCTMAIWHQPRFSSGEEHGNDPTVDPFWRALYAAGADVIVNGHDHDYERFAPQDPDGDEDRGRGIREFVVGTGGMSLRGFNDPQPNSELRLAVSHGVIEFTLRARHYDWRFIPTEPNSPTDTGSAPCH